MDKKDVCLFEFHNKKEFLGKSNRIRGIHVACDIINYSCEFFKLTLVIHIIKIIKSHTNYCK